MMLEDEVMLAALALPPLFDEIVAASPITCTLWICAGHRTRAETKAVHEAIESCYAAASD
jgi:hypothetical protein